MLIDICCLLWLCTSDILPGNPAGIDRDGCSANGLFGGEHPSGRALIPVRAVGDAVALAA